jgi:UDP-3-O-[3-hydroxymyristoyl] N-acetylglucosamine deacetylase
MIQGPGLHTGLPCSVRFLRAPGPVRIRVGDCETEIGALVADGDTRSTRVRAGTVEVGTIEHVFSVLGAHGVSDGLVVELEGPEAPIADGGAAAFFDALGPMPPPSPRFAIVREETIVVDGRRYAFSPGARRIVDVTVDFDDPRLAAHARWEGDPADFRSRIAPARTFGFAHEMEMLLARGLARHVLPESVVLVTPEAVLARGAPFQPDEPARHKLLDLIGDLFVHGGPFLGTVRAERPGHAATHEAIRRARVLGIVARREVTTV